MARIRTIKPEFFTSEDIVELSPLARLLYIALWCEADREGRLNWKPRTLKMKYLPAESCDVMLICDELVSSNLVKPYVIDGEPYAVLPSFKKHQAINVREAKSSIPAPPDGVHVHAREKDAWMVSADVRATVLARDAHKCVRCGTSDHLQIDHIFPKSMGGTNAITNLRVLCRSCNAGRPVCGQGLIDDLAIDGLTLNDMQRMCMHVQGDGEGKGREGKGKEGKEEKQTNFVRSSSADDDGEASGVPPCPHQDIIAAYHEILPMLPGVREWTPARRTALAARWREKPERQNIAWWRKLFSYVAESDFLTGRVSRGRGHDAWQCSLPWLLKPENFAKLLEGHYENREVSA